MGPILTSFPFRLVFDLIVLFLFLFFSGVSFFLSSAELRQISVVFVNLGIRLHELNALTPDILDQVSVCLSSSAFVHSFLFIHPSIRPSIFLPPSVFLPFSLLAYMSCNALTRTGHGSPSSCLCFLFLC